MAHAIDLKADADYAGKPGILTRLRQTIADHREYRAIYAELNARTDRELADFGLSRLNLRESVRDAVHRS